MAVLPRGIRIAFERNGKIFAATFPNIKNAVAVGEGQDPTISPNGKQIAFEESKARGERTFCIRDADAGRLIKRHVGTMPHFSLDGKRIAFSIFNGSRWTLWVSDVALTAPRKITGSGKDDPAFPSGWTASGLLITYSEQIGGGLYALRPDGSVARKVLVSEIAGKLDTSIPLGCAWSDDLKRIVFEAQTGEELVDGGQPLTGLYVYDFGTRKRRLLTPKGMTGSNPVWAGQNLLLFASGRNTKRYAPTQIQALDVNTGTAEPLIPNVSKIAITRRGV